MMKSNILDALEYIGFLKHYHLNVVPIWLREMENDLLKARENEKVLEIIKEKSVDCFALCKILKAWENESSSLSAYNAYCISDKYRLSQEEFDLLKRWLDDEK